MRRFKDEERGISSVIAVVSLLGIFGAAMLSVDAGNMWQTRRNIISGTDSTALDQAKYLASAADTSQCSNGSVTGVPAWTDYLIRNSGGGTGVDPISCTPHANADGTGYVVVEGRKDARTRFGGLFGIGDTSPYSLSAAQWGFASDGRGLRPISFCNKNHHVVEWLALQNPGGAWGTLTQAAYNQLPVAEPTEVWVNPNNGQTSTRVSHYYGPTGGVVHRMYFNNSLEDGQCGEFPGNWGWLNFDGGSAPNTDRNEWTSFGWNDGAITIRENDDPVCPDDPGNGTQDDAEAGCVPSDSGAISTANAPALDDIIGVPIQVMLFDTGECSGGSGGGVTCNFEAWAFLGVILRGYQTTGNEETRYLDFEFTEIMLSGTCCTAGGPPNGVDTGVRVAKICEVDHDFQPGSTIQSRCTPTT